MMNFKFLFFGTSAALMVAFSATEDANILPKDDAVPAVDKFQVSSVDRYKSGLPRNEYSPDDFEYQSDNEVKTEVSDSLSEK